MARPHTKHLTDLEGAALAFIVRAGSCTAYAVRDGFRTSPSDFWSGSAGAVYPMIERLERRGYVTSKADRDDKRGRRHLSATPAGRTALLAWLTDAERAAGWGFDPLRIRLFFADLIPADKLRVFIRETEGLLAESTPPPSPSLPHVLTLHAAWAKFRQAALAAFVRNRGR